MREVNTETYRSFSKGLKREIKSECFKPYQSDTRNPFKLLDMANEVEERIRALKDDISETEDESEEIQQLNIDTRKKKSHKEKMGERSNKCYKCHKKGYLINYAHCIYHNIRNEDYVGSRVKICYACRDEEKQAVFPCIKHRIFRRRRSERSNPCRNCGEEFPCRDKECDAYRKFIKNKERRNKGAKGSEAASDVDSDTESEKGTFLLDIQEEAMNRSFSKEEKMEVTIRKEETRENEESIEENSEGEESFKEESMEDASSMEEKTMLEEKEDYKDESFLALLLKSHVFTHGECKCENEDQSFCDCKA